jgi:ABC-type Fe3+ transport system permease subunit
MKLTHFLRKIYGEGISRILYSTILVISVMESLDDYPTNSFAIMVIILLTVISILLIESYSHLLEEDIKYKRVTKPEGIRKIVKMQLPVFIAAIYPCLFFSLSLIGIIKVDTAFDLSEYSLAGMLFIYGFTARRISGAKILRSLFAGTISLLIGLMIANIKVLSDLLKKYI